MMFWTIVRVALGSLMASKLRSTLAMLGIVIGVWSVISALALASGAQQSVTDRISAMGTNLLTITPGLRGTGGVISGNQKNLKPDDALSLVGQRFVVRVAPVVRGTVQVRYYNKNSPTSCLGTAPTYFSIRHFLIHRGRTLTDGDVEESSRVAVIGPTTAKNLFGASYEWGIGESVGVNGVTYRIIGILQSKGDQVGFSPDDQIIIPYTTAMKQVLGQDYLSEIDISATSAARLNDLQTEATLLLRHRHRLGDDTANDFNIRNQAEMLSAFANINMVLSLLLGGIAGISLLVGGIGVMNIMLVTVAERTREIGIRKAIGAKRRDILRQFLIESVVISALGGAFGAAAGVSTSWLATAVQSYVALIVRPYSILLALAFSAAVGVFFGYYPARSAAKLDPIEALRYE